MTATITDFNQFTGLRAAADKKDPAALREVASQFEALFLQTMLKNMREASLGDPLFGNSDQHEMYQGMMDQQLALEMASGKGIGLADMLVRQLGGSDNTTPYRPDRDYPIADLSRANLVGGPSRPDSRLEAAPTTRTVGGPSRPDSRLEAAPTAAPTSWTDPKTFARDIWPHAERAGRRLNVAPEAIVAQAALESGWGAHVMPDKRGDNSFNLFGIKAGAGWGGEQVRRQTLEFEDGLPRPQKAAFRTYSDVAATFEDYTRLLTDNPRYRDVSGHGADVAGFAKALQASGYATDPDYAEKLRGVANSPTMQSVIRELKNSRAQPITAQLSPRAY